MESNRDLKNLGNDKGLYTSTKGCIDPLSQYIFISCYQNSQHSRYQNSTLTLPELKTHVTRTQNSCYQNSKLQLPELKNHVTITIINRY